MKLLELFSGYCEAHRQSGSEKRVCMSDFSAFKLRNNLIDAMDLKTFLANLLVLYRDPTHLPKDVSEWKFLEYLLKISEEKPICNDREWKKALHQRPWSTLPMIVRKAKEEEEMKVMASKKF